MNTNRHLPITSLFIGGPMHGKLHQSVSHSDVLALPVLPGVPTMGDISDSEPVPIAVNEVTYTRLGKLTNGLVIMVHEDLSSGLPW